jgi:hypothetical protein
MRDLSVLTVIAFGACVAPAPFDARPPSEGARLEASYPAVRRAGDGTLVIGAADGRGGTSEIPVFAAPGRFNPEAATLSSFATDPVEDRAFVVQAFPTATAFELDAMRPNRYRVPLNLRTLYALDPDGTAREVTRLDDESLPSFVFTDDAVIVMTCGARGGHLRRFDRRAMTLQREAWVLACPGSEAPYVMSRWIVLRHSYGLMYYIDPTTLEAGTLPLEISAQYFEIPLRTQDAIVRVVAESRAVAHTRIPYRVERYELAGATPAQLSDRSPRRVGRIELTSPQWGDHFGLYGNYPQMPTPDERALILPDTQGVQLLELATGAVRPLPVAPTGINLAAFTPDGRGFIGYSPALYPSNGARLWHVTFDDPAPRALAITLPTAPRVVFPSASPHALLTAGNTDVVLWRMDLAQGDARRVSSFGPTPPVFTTGAARGGEAWLLRDGLVRINAASLDELRAPIEWVPTRIAVPRVGDVVLVDVPRRNTVARLRGDTGQVEREYRLPVPAPPLSAAGR